jgi:hypothetical protein
VVGNIEIHVWRPVLCVESDHFGGMIFLECPYPSVPDAPDEIPAPRWRVDATEENDGQGGAFVPLEHGDESFLEHEVIRFVDTTCITPCPIESSAPHDLAEHLQFVVSGKLIEVVHDDVYDLVEQRFVDFPLVRKRGVTVVLLNFLFDAGVIDICGHGRDQLREDWQQFECGGLLRFVAETTRAGVNEYSRRFANSILNDPANSVFCLGVLVITFYEKSAVKLLDEVITLTANLRIMGLRHL